MDILSEKWKKRFISLAKEVAQWSKDPSTKVGAYIFDETGRPISHGYNGFARGVEDNEHRLNDRSLKYKFIAHAERNALDNATKHDLSDCVLFCTHFPCPNCAIGIIQKGIKTIVVDKENGYNSTGDFSIRHKEDMAISMLMLTEAGVEVKEI